MGLTHGVRTRTQHWLLWEGLKTEVSGNQKKSQLWQGRDVIIWNLPNSHPFHQSFSVKSSLRAKYNMALERNRARDRPETRSQSSNVLDGREEEDEDVWCWNNDVSSTAMIWWCGRLDTLAGQWYYNYLSSYVQISSLHLVLYWRHWRVCCCVVVTVSQVTCHTVVVVANVQYIRVKYQTFYINFKFLQMKKYFLNFLIDIFTFKKYFP